ncbi:septin-4 isoform X1 [Pteronotus mesoamericanus]|uniref:septin-4 isoform X1 n=1 Tax=Pteronotus mesoamericanus TaxID=1884717 RepID=UPI0023EC1293|nr:septin-4 isoform X1 [Pteronotus parnellii mesoamericanus]
MVKMNKTGPKVTVSAQKGAEVTNTTPQRGHGSIAVSTQRSAAVSSTPSVHQKSEARHPIIPPSSSRYPRSVSLQAGPGFSGAPTRGGTESRSKSEAYQHSTLQQKIQQTQTPLPHAVQTQQKISLSREEATRKGGESKSGRDSKHYSLIPDAKSFRQLVFLDQKNNKQILQEEDPPSKVQYPQGVRVSRKSLVSPKDEAVQTEPIRKSVTAAEVRFSRRTSSPEHGNRLIFADSRTAQRRIPGQESETGLRNSTHTEPKALHRSKNLESSLTLSILKDVGSGRQFSVRTEHEPIHKHSAYTEPSPPARVLTSSEVESNIKSPVRGDSETSRRVIICSEAQPAQTAHHVTSRAGTESPRKSFMFTFPEPVYKQHTWRPSESVRTSPGYILKHPDPSPNSVRAKVELTPRPLPPRPLPKYGPESSWWTLLNTEVEMPQSQLTTSDFEAKSLPPIDYSLSSFEIDSSPFCEDMMFLREKTSTSPPPAPATPPPLQSPKESPSRPLLRGVPQAPKCTSKQPTQRFSAFFLDVSEEMYNRVIWWLKDEEIKRFLEDTDDAELNKFGKDFPGNESCHQPEAKTWVSRPQVPEPTPQAPDLYQNDLEFRSPLWPQPSDSQQYFCASAPLSPSARPRSPWGKLDPYDSSEDDKEYVGFATLPNQVHRKSVKKGFDFTLMVAGESGLGKSTLVNSLFLTDLYRDRKLLSAEERIMQTVEITKHAVDIEEKGVKLRLTIVDTPGFGDAVNNTECWKPVAEYIDQQFEQYFRDESGLNRKNIQDNRVHCCLYFISPFGHGLRPLDVEFMKALHQRVNIVPILAKADTLTPPEVERKKRKIREEIEHFGIKVYQFPDCDSDEDEDFKLQDQALKESIPFAVIGSNTVVEARGRRVRGRLYPWGIVEVENPGHCDFVKLRTMLVRTHMQDLKDVTRETHYENYRAQCIQSMTRLVVKERNRNKLTRESGTDFPIPAVPPGADPETERLIREKDEELRRMQEMLHKIQRQMKETH